LVLDVSRTDAYSGRIVDPGRQASLEVHAPSGRTATSVQLDGVALAYTQADGVVSIALAAGGDLEIAFGTSFAR
jgi:hypothetical protein